MNKLVANISLLVITFFAAIQYIFLANIPPSVSSFCFIFITNLIGLLITTVFFCRELKHIKMAQIKQGFIMAVELFGFNVFLIRGTQGMDATVVSCVVTAFFVFVPFIMLFKKQKVPRESIFAILLVLIGVFLVMDANIKNFFNIRILYLVVADIMFAAYIVTAESFTLKSNPAVLAITQLLFGAILAFGVWVAESLVLGISLSISKDPSFWLSIFFISFFIRGLYGVVQIYAQRYVSAINISIIFSTEVIITLLVSPILSPLIGEIPMEITVLKLFGCMIMIVGVLVSDGILTKFFFQFQNFLLNRLNGFFKKFIT